jgi:hypothetical protein
VGSFKAASVQAPHAAAAAQAPQCSASYKAQSNARAGAGQERGGGATTTSFRRGDGRSGGLSPRCDDDFLPTWR